MIATASTLQLSTTFGYSFQLPKNYTECFKGIHFLTEREKNSFNFERDFQSMTGKMTKRPFTLEEDQKLLQFVSLNGPRNWGQLAQQLTNRTPKQCRERWNNQLNPAINKGPWTWEEDAILAEKQRLLGNRWAEIAKFLPGRTDTLVKNRWNTSVKARLSDFRAKEVMGSTAFLEDWLNQVTGETRQPVLSLSDFQTLPPLMSNSKTPNVI